MSDLLFAKALALGGVFSWRDAQTTGLRGRDLRRLVKNGHVIDAGPRAYLLAEAHKAAETPEEQHRLQVLAVLRSFEGRVAASHHSAAALHTLPFWRVGSNTVHVARLTGKASRRRSGLTVHQAYPEGAVICSGATGMQSVNPALAVIGTAMLDGEEAGIVAADHALHRQIVARSELDEWLRRLAHHPHIAGARRAMARTEPLTESVGESRTRLILDAMPDLPPVTPQFPFLDERGEEWARADFVIGDRLVLEFDGRKKYRAADGASTREVEDIVWAEKRREDRIRGTRKVVVRIVWADLDRPRQVQAMIRAGLRDVDALLGPAA